MEVVHWEAGGQLVARERRKRRVRRTILLPEALRLLAGVSCSGRVAESRRDPIVAAKSLQEALGVLQVLEEPGGEVDVPPGVQAVSSR